MAFVEWLQFRVPCMRTFLYLMLVLLCWFTLGLILELNREPSYGANYLVGLGFDLLLVIIACATCAGLCTKSQRLCAMSAPSKMLLSFIIAFVAGLPVVVAQQVRFGDPVYIRLWDVYWGMFYRGPEWIVIVIHLFVTMLLAAGLYFVIRRREVHRPHSAHRRYPVGILNSVILLGLVCANVYVARHYSLALKSGRPDHFLTHDHSIGTSVGAFRLTDTEGSQILHDPRANRVLLVNFFATWCGPCVLEMPHLQKIWEENREDPRFSMVIVGLGEPIGALIEFKEENLYTMPFASDESGTIYSQFGLDGTIPHTCVLQHGRIGLSITGYDENRLDELNQYLEATLRQSPGHRTNASSEQ
ncbi:TlpA family protein disulfide reductase [Aeoliella sp. ICT_H6.2]|uniref:TlpA family protein disulfide reductase n=1 Tax=Aeoliella straminimaris TaxID=2954799 RepID=A0A9X2JHR4_9BACT|nr:TlpA disulfide reductase family protein [Aeoliella straminimaris]MCO6043184.1 TlpA family protein disulfide reductase [Aeoliella straminimaris]